VKISAQTLEFVRCHQDDDVRDLALHAHANADIDMLWALDQIEGRRRARHKLPQWAEHDGIVYPPHISMEQCSSQQTALYKAALARRLVGQPSRPANNRDNADSTDNTVDGNNTDDVNNADNAAMGKTPRRLRYVELTDSFDADRSMSNPGDRVIPAKMSPHSVLVDLTGGFGVDCSYMARGFDQATYVEQQEHLCEIAEHNMRVLGLDHVAVVHMDAVSFVRQMDDASLIFIDPARRDSHGSRMYAIADCTPNVLDMRDQMLEKAPFVMIKLSPMLDWRKAVQDFEGCVSEIHMVSVANECKELLVVLSREHHASQPIRIVCVDDEHEFSYQVVNGRYEEQSDTDDAGRTDTGRAATDGEVTGGAASQYALPTNETRGQTRPAKDMRGAGHAQYLYEPNASIMKAGCFGLVAERFQVKQVGVNSHLFVSDTYAENFPGRAFSISGITSMNKRAIRSVFAGIQQANITVRNFPVNVAALRKRLDLRDGGDIYLFATTADNGKHIIIVTRKV
jgi:hypothetical protein